MGKRKERSQRNPGPLAPDMDFDTALRVIMAYNPRLGLRWNPNTDGMEQFSYTDDQAASKRQSDTPKPPRE